jgi:alkylated DNA nucleotide flippase Atl1
MVSLPGPVVWEVLRRREGRECDVLPTPFAERVLDLVSTIPPGRVLTYGDVAERLGSRAPRAVGTTLARFGGGVPWWRVVRAGGHLAPGHEVSATAHLVAEGVELLPSANGPRVDLARHRWTTDP